jgi:hypothetical protein
MELVVIEGLPAVIVGDEVSARDDGKTEVESIGNHVGGLLQWLMWLF